MPVIRRITMFKIPSQEDQNKLLEMYKTLQAKAIKDGQKYILTAEAGRTKEDPRSQGYTIAATTTFKSMEDFEFYDTKCEAHGELKQFARSIQQGMCMLYFEVDS